MLMNNPKSAAIERLARCIYDSRHRRESERLVNVQRLITHNNRRILAGLRPLDMPAALGMQWDRPVNRDYIALTER